ncbi:hypothetical protein [Vagococcus intermedius]|uniref:Collagen-like protein n=1 Tax=Vagococcus intermedius TaxID=2991418 RepID=A0AAF0IA69_9ENTE|nr:hypothetical protein [Vagococcus intermedius]WEG74192.1 hypothetical protein OL234_04660 [Vagococcus intermedius]WEG76273.1 hypothetical protein OL235_04665 [Vagococcus intermedius]
MDEIIEVIESESLLLAEASFLEMAYDPDSDLKGNRKKVKKNYDLDSDSDEVKSEGLDGLNGNSGKQGNTGLKGNQGYLGNLGKIGKEGKRLDALNFSFFNGNREKKWAFPKISEKVELESVLSFVFVTISLSLIYFTLRQQDD